MSVNYARVENIALGIVENGFYSSSDTPRLIDEMEERRGGWRGCSPEVPSLHRLLVAYLYCSPYIVIDWHLVAQWAGKLRAAQDADHAAGIDPDLDD